MKKLFTMVLMLVVVLAGCGSKESTDQSGEKESIRFSIWDETQQEGYQKIIDQFETENPNIDVTLEVTPWGDYWTKLETDALAGTAPDVVALDPAYYLQYQQGDLLMNLDDIVMEKGINLSKYNQSLIDAYSVDGSLFALPRDRDVIGLYYNKQILADAGAVVPTNWDEFLTEAKKIQDYNPEIMPLMLEIGQSGHWNLLAENGVEIIGEDGQSNYNTPEAIKALQFYQDLAVKYDMIPQPSEGDIYPPDALLSNNAAFILAGSWVISSIENSEVTDNIGVALLPNVTSMTSGS
ncbi:MAG: ABC transporter substrate-binding protein, partial [Erysipelotrichaceae bacterium]